MSEYERALQPSKVLLEKHRNVLYKSGLSNQTINELGSISSMNGDSLLEAIKDISNAKIRGYRVRYNNEVIEQNKYPSSEGKTPKYRPSKELGNAFFYPHLSTLIRWTEIAKNISVPIFLTEGGKKASLLAQHGYACIGLFGVNNWVSKKKNKDENGNEVEVSEPIEDFKDIVWGKRIVYIVFDSDKYRNINVLLAEAKLFEYLRSLEADIRVINLPYDIEAKGIDDFFVKYGC